MLSEVDVWGKLKDLPSLSRLEVHRKDLKGDLIPLFLDVCKGLKFLKMQECNLTSAQLTSSSFGIQKLSISQDCGMDIAGFTSRCHSLEELSIGHSYNTNFDYDDYDERRMVDLREFLDSGKLRDLHLDLDIDMPIDKYNIIIPTRISCLRKFRAESIDSSSIPSLRFHFNRISEICTFGPPGFWREVLSSCTGLRIAGEVNLSGDDIMRGKPWVCHGLKSLDLWDVDDRAVEEALLRRISHLGKLDLLCIEGHQYHRKGVDGNGLVTWQPFPDCDENALVSAFEAARRCDGIEEPADGRHNQMLALLGLI